MLSEVCFSSDYCYSVIVILIFNAILYAVGVVVAVTVFAWLAFFVKGDIYSWPKLWLRETKV